MKKEILLTDLTRCEPANAISRDAASGKWLAADYEVDEGKGVMLFALPGLGAPPLTLRLGLSGWHEIRLGVFYGGSAGFLIDRLLSVRLSEDAAESRISMESYRPVKDGSYPEKNLRWWDIADVFWKCADLTGQDLIIAHPPGLTADLQTNLAYVRLVPMDRSTVNEWQAEQPREETRVLIATYDGGTYLESRIANREVFLAEFGCLRDSDFDIALFTAAYGPITFYPSKVGEFARASGLWGRGAVVRDLAANGIDPLEAAIEAAHSCGIKLFAQVRFEGPQVPPEHIRADHGGRFMEDHPEWLCRYPDGEPVRHLSFAYKGVRDFYVRMMREWVEDYVADGVNVLFSRSQPFVYYEQPVREAFAAQYGKGMQSLPPGDERVQRVRASFVTQLLRETREMLDEVGEAQGRYIPNCYFVPVNNSPSIDQEGFQIPPNPSALSECLFNALDVPAWIAGGLVDYLVVHLHVYGEHDGTAVQPNIREFTELARGTNTKIFIEVYPRRMPPRQYRRIAMSYYEAGADGLAFWDSPCRYQRASEWAFVKRLGHRDDLPRWQGKGDDYHRVVPIRRLDGFLTEREFGAPTDG